MKITAAVCQAINEDIATLQFREILLPAPGPDEVQISIKACSVNFTDILMMQGKYQFKPPIPFTPGGGSCR